MLPLWQRLTITVVAMLIASFVVSLVWESLLGFPMPGYAAGLVGGLSALPVWEVVKRIRPK